MTGTTRTQLARTASEIPLALRALYNLTLKDLAKPGRPIFFYSISEESMAPQVHPENWQIVPHRRVSVATNNHPCLYEPASVGTYPLISGRAQRAMRFMVENYKHVMEKRNARATQPKNEQLQSKDDVEMDYELAIKGLVEEVEGMIGKLSRNARKDAEAVIRTTLGW
ncbi:hypothetical protein P280DRAFT_475778 [Massarina eburnea CBS 473.64]|uniref:Uncharacterized protein n=1 Tax=Massarina eburnea CBS 473.64 TaxID=1395130 RepID=A0A6A6SBM5_9PLEO|nr:hypothetical protein P280DRAFT_475778 [Massarina eburnea CBS 473.64]